MASITLTGTLLDPTGEVAVGDQIRFTHRTTTGETIQFARSILIIPPNGLYNITLEFGLIFVEYLDVKDVHYKSLGVVTVNGDTTATDLPGLLNAIVPPTDAQLLLFQGILADTEDARDIALLAAAQQTTLELIASTTTHPNSTVLTLSGHTLPGDGGGGKWQLNGVVGQTPSQSPTQLADFLLNDGNGNQWALVDGVILAFNGVQYLPLPFGATGNGNYAYNNNDFDKITDPDRLNPATLAIWQDDASAQLDDVVTTAERSTGNGGGFNADVVLASTITLNDTTFIASTAVPSLAIVFRGGVLNVNVTLKIGTGFDFATINEALTYLDSASRISDVEVILELQSGFVMAEQVFAIGIDLGWLRITSVDAQVTVQRSSLTDTVPNLDLFSTPAFLALNNGTLPIISALFSMDTTGAADSTKQHGVMVAKGGRVLVEKTFGFINATGRGLYGVNGFAYGRNTKWNNAGTHGVRAGNGSIFNIRECEITGCGEHGIIASGVSSVLAQDANVSANTKSNVRVESLSTVMFEGSTGNLAGDANVAIRSGGRFFAANAILDQGTLGNLDVDDGFVHAPGADLSDSPVREVFVRGASVVNIELADLSTTVDGSDNVVSAAGATVVINGATITAGSSQRVFTGGKIIAVSLGTGLVLNVTPNKITTDGTIITDDITRENSANFVPIGVSTKVVEHDITVDVSINDVAIFVKEQFSGASQIWVSAVDNAADPKTFTVTTDANVTSSALDFSFHIDIP